MSRLTALVTRPQRALRGDVTGMTGLRRRLAALGLVAVVVVLDQATKWWGWRHAHRAIINSGGTWFIGPPLEERYSGSITGPLLDFFDLGLLAWAGVVLLRRRRPRLVLISAALTIGGWSSNLLDRLGMHVVTAPGQRPRSRRLHPAPGPLLQRGRLRHCRDDGEPPAGHRGPAVAPRPRAPATGRPTTAHQLSGRPDRPRPTIVG